MSVGILVLLIVAVIVFLILAKKRKNTEGITNNAPPYFRKKTLLNEKEQILFHRLIEAMPQSYVLAQVRLADIVSVKKSTINWQTWFNKISRKSVDFVICDKSFVVLACIELDGKTHAQEDRQKADENKDEALQAAGIPIVRIEASKLSSTEEIKALLEKAILHRRSPSVDN